PGEVVAVLRHAAPLVGSGPAIVAHPPVTHVISVTGVTSVNMATGADRFEGPVPSPRTRRNRLATCRSSSRGCPRLVPPPRRADPRAGGRHRRLRARDGRGPHLRRRLAHR